MWEATCLRFAVSSLRWRDLMSDPSLPALPVSNVSFHAIRLPADWSLWSRCDCLFLRFGFKRRQAFRGCTCICSSTSSSPPLPPILSLCVPLFKSSQASLSLCLRSSFFQVETGGSKQPGSFPSFFSPPHFLLFHVGLLPLYFPVTPLLLFSKLSWEKTLINHFEGAKSALVYFYQQTRSLVDLERLQISSTNTQIKIYTLYFATHTQTLTRTHAWTRKHIQQSNSAKFLRQFDGSVALLLL